MNRTRAALGFALLVLLCACGDDAPPAPAPVPAPTDDAPPAYEMAEAYRLMRSAALDPTHEFHEGRDLGGGLICVLMEMGYDDAAASLIAYRDGTTSLYFSGGGGVLGGGEHQPVAKASERFRHEAENHQERLGRVRAFPLPEPDHVRFYLVRHDGVWSGSAAAADLERRDHRYRALYARGHDVLAQIRLHTEK